MVKGCEWMAQEDSVLKELLESDDVDGVKEHLQGYVEKRSTWSGDAERMLAWYRG
jgi:hypothetical protein